MVLRKHCLHAAGQTIDRLVAETKSKEALVLRLANRYGSSTRQACKALRTHRDAAATLSRLQTRLASSSQHKVTLVWERMSKLSRDRQASQDV